LLGQSKGKKDARNVLTSAPASAFDDEWDAHVETTVARMKVAAQAKSLADVEQKWSKCDHMYGVGCPYRSLCLTYKQSKGKKPMGLMSRVSSSTAAPIPPTPPSTPPAATVASTPSTAVQSFGSIKVKDCQLGAEYQLDASGKTGEFTGTAKDVGFFQTKDGSVKLSVGTLVAPIGIAQATALVTPPATVTAPKGELKVEYDPGQAPAPAVLPPDAPKSNPALASEQPKISEAETPKRGSRKPKTEEAVLAAPTAKALRIFHNALPSGGGFESLAEYVAATKAKLEADFQVDDLRTAPTDSPLGFGKWKGHFSRAIRANPPAPGSYVLVSQGSELMDVVVETLEQLCTPGNFVRGIR
jgi:hypothetical protein